MACKERTSWKRFSTNAASKAILVILYKGFFKKLTIIIIFLLSNLFREPERRIQPKLFRTWRKASFLPQPQEEDPFHKRRSKSLVSPSKGRQE